MKQGLILGALMVGLLVGANSAEAQFHNKDGESGQLVMNPQARANMFAQQNKSQIGRGVATRDGNTVGFQNSAHYLPGWAADPKYGGAIRLGEMGDRNSFVLGQVVHHSDGSYTQTTREEKMTRELKDIEQTTYSPRGVKLAKRTVTHNEKGQPQVVIIRDANDKFKYRGVLVYDELSRRLKEEQLFDTNNTLLRRTIQKYDSQGMRMPCEIYDYVKDLPMDLHLVVSEENEKMKEVKKKRIFQKREKESSTGVTTGAAPAETEKKGLRNLFNFKKKDQ